MAETAPEIPQAPADPAEEHPSQAVSEMHGARAQRHDEHTGKDELVMFLERDQLVIDKSQPVPRAALSPRARAALWVLRVFVLIVSAMVIYTFFSQLSG